MQISVTHKDYTFTVTTRRSGKNFAAEGAVTHGGSPFYAHDTQKRRWDREPAAAWDVAQEMAIHFTHHHGFDSDDVYALVEAFEAQGATLKHDTGLFTLD